MSDTGSTKCKIIIDAMGGDFSPLNEVLGAVQAVKELPDTDLFLIGKEEEIKKVLVDNNLSFKNENIINAPDVISMSDSPTQAIKSKPNSSIVLGNKLIREKKADAFVSTGNTGAVMAAATLIMGRIPGVGRPTIGAVMPNINGVCAVFDVGASVDSKASHLLEYAVMGTIFTRELYHIENPTIGLLNVGEEESKGNEISLAALNLIKQTNLNFIGNVEGRDILNGKVNVIVCDGFVGNILLKFGEGVLTFLKYKFKEFAGRSIINKIKIGLVRSAMRSILKDFDYQEQGGVPLLGVNGICIIGHGSSTPNAITKMIHRADEMYRKNLISKIENSLKQNSKL